MNKESNSKSRLTKNVIFLGLVSMFTDLSSQMIYPLIPEFLSSMGATKTIIGLIEGIAESTASVLRAVFGRLSDKIKKRKLFIYLGYGLSALSKPFLFFAHTWITVLGVRFSDRIGKAARTPARDALISTSIDPSIKGKAFGFHRAMDRVGAIGGPLLALLVLSVTNRSLRLVFLFSVVPGLIALIFIKFTKEVNIQDTETGNVQVKKGLKSPGFIWFFISVIIFQLGNSSNSFLILKARETGIDVKMIPVIWIVYNIFCTISSPIFGTLSDKVGRRYVIYISFIYYSLIYLLFAFAGSPVYVWFLFAAYGVYYGLSEGVYRAYIADIVEPENRATAYGIFNTGVGLALFPASMIMGFVWDIYGSRAAFILSALFSILAFIIFSIVHMVFRYKGKY